MRITTSTHRPAVKRSQGFRLRSTRGDSPIVLSDLALGATTGLITAAGCGRVGRTGAFRKATCEDAAISACSDLRSYEGAGRPATIPLTADGPIAVDAIRFLPCLARMRPVWPRG